MKPGGGDSSFYRLNPSPCRAFVTTGTCSYGERCKFTHGPNDPRELRAPTGPRPPGGDMPSDNMAPMNMMMVRPCQPGMYFCALCCAGIEGRSKQCSVPTWKYKYSLVGCASHAQAEPSASSL